MYNGCFVLALGMKVSVELLQRGLPLGLLSVIPISLWISGSRLIRGHCCGPPSFLSHLCCSQVWFLGWLFLKIKTGETLGEVLYAFVHRKLNILYRKRICFQGLTQGGERTKFTSTEELSSSGSYDNSSLLPSHIYLHSFLSSNFYCWLSRGIFQCWLLPTLGGKPVTLEKITKPSNYQQGWYWVAFPLWYGGCELVSAYIELLQKPGQNCAGCWCLLTCFNIQ